MLGTSFFMWQLERRGINVRDGLHQTHLQRILVRQIMKPLEKPRALEQDEPHVRLTDPLGKALSLLEEGNRDHVCVVTLGKEPEVVGILTYRAALTAYN